jgi:hypothetical protein
LFSTKLVNFPVSRGNLEDKSVCMGNEGNTRLNVPVETKETEATMCLWNYYNYNFVPQLIISYNWKVFRNYWGRGFAQPLSICNWLSVCMCTAWYILSTGSARDVLARDEPTRTHLWGPAIMDLWVPKMKTLEKINFNFENQD